MKVYLWKNKYLTAVLMLLILLESFVSIQAILYINQVISSLLEKDIHQFLFFAGINIILWLVFLLLSSFRNIFQESFVQKVILQMKRDFTHRLTEIGFEKFQEKEIGEYVSCYNNDMDKIENTGYKSFFEWWRYSTVLFMSVYALWEIHFGLIVFVCVSLLGIFYVPQLWVNNLSKETLALSEKQEKYVSYMTTLMQGYSLFYFSNKFSLFSDFSQKYAQALSKQKINLEWKNQITSFVIQFLSLFSQVGLILFAGYLVLIGQMAFGFVLAVGNLAGQLFSSFSQWTYLFSKMKTVEVLIEKLKISEPTHAIPTKVKEKVSGVDVLSLVDVSYAVGEKKILQSNSFAFEKGKKYLIVGESGAGKSTVLKILSGVKNAYTGSVFVDGKEIRNIDTKAYNQFIDFVPEKTVLFEGTLKENIVLFDEKVDDKKYNEILSLLNLEKMKDVLSVKNLSLGEKQRIAIAQMLYREKEIVFLDETFSNLDAENFQNILMYLLGTSKMILLISHQLPREYYAYFDRILRIKDGFLVEEKVALVGES